MLLTPRLMSIYNLYTRCINLMPETLSSLGKGFVANSLPIGLIRISWKRTVLDAEEAS